MIIATVSFGPEAATPAAADVAPDDEADPDFPPEDEHAVNANDAAESATTAPTTRLERIMISYLSIVAAASRRRWMVRPAVAGPNGWPPVAIKLSRRLRCPCRRSGAAALCSVVEPIGRG